MSIVVHVTAGTVPLMEICDDVTAELNYRNIILFYVLLARNRVFVALCILLTSSA